MPQMLMEHLTDPADEIREKVSSVLDQIEIFGNQILIGIYKRPEKTKSGLFLADGTRDEDVHQGKAGVVLKMGPNAFVSDANYDFKGQKAEVGDWVAVYVLDGKKIKVLGQECRLINDTYIRMKIPAPDVVW